MIFKRKIYDELLAWKRQSDGSTALLVEGARRVGKSSIVEEFAKREYVSFILVDFNRPKPGVVDAIAWEAYCLSLNSVRALLTLLSG